jgi:hypothetical protein
MIHARYGNSWWGARSSVLRRMGRYCPHPPNPLGRVGLERSDVRIVGVRGLFGLAFRSIPIRPSVLIPSFLVATLFMWYEYGELMSPELNPALLQSAYYPLCAVLFVACIIAAWFVMRSAARIVSPTKVAPASLRQFGAFLIVSCLAVLLSVATNIIAWGFENLLYAAGMVDCFAQLGSLAPLGSLSWILFNYMTSGLQYWYSPWFAGLDLLAMGVSRGVVLGSVLFAPLQVFYFLTVAEIITKDQRLRRALLESGCIVRRKPLQFFGLSVLFALIAVPFESFLGVASDIRWNWAPWTYMWWGNWGLSTTLMRIFQTLSDTLVGPGVVFYLRAFLAPLLIIMVFYYQRATARQ